jgi:hypothetical protein
MMEHELGKRVTRLLASHFSSTQQGPRYIDIPTQHRLSSVHGGIAHNLVPLIVDMCVGSRVKFTAQGEGQKPSLVSSCLVEADHELPIVLVRIDGDDESFPCSCVSSVSRVVVPITPLPSPQRIQ